MDTDGRHEACPLSKRILSELSHGMRKGDSQTDMIGMNMDMDRQHIR